MNVNLAIKSLETVFINWLLSDIGQDDTDFKLLLFFSNHPIYIWTDDGYWLHCCRTKQKENSRLKYIHTF